MSSPRPQAGSGRSLELWTGWLFMGAGAIHGIVTRTHFEEWWGYGLFFLFAAVLQVVWGLALITKAINPKDAGAKWYPMKTGFLVLGILGTFLTLLLYLVTRTIGIPFFGPEAGTVEEVAPVDVLSKFAESALLLLLWVLLRRHLAAKPVTAAGANLPG